MDETGTGATGDAGGAATGGVGRVPAVAPRGHARANAGRWLDGQVGVAALIALCAALLVSRRPDAMLNAQFWAEDGRFWYAQADALGLGALWLPHNGYFQTVSKLTGLFSLAFPLAWAPLVFNVVALAFKLLPIALLHSARGRKLVPDRAARLAATLLYVGHPYAAEVHLNITNVHWHLALGTMLLLLFVDEGSRAKRLAESALVVLCGLSGVFSLFLAPVAAWIGWQRRDRRSRRFLLLLVVCAAIQLMALVQTYHGARSSSGLGATVDLALRIVGGQYFGAAVVGPQWTEWNAHALWRDSIWLPALVSILGAAWLARAWWSGPMALRAFLLMAALVGSASLLSPQVSVHEPQWPLLARLPFAVRYVFIPILAWYAALMWCAWRDPQRAVRGAATVILLVIAFRAIPDHWMMTPYVDLDFQEHAARYEAAPPGARVAIPINPPGWSMSLVKPDA